jgi:hypothetical protein
MDTSTCIRAHMFTRNPTPTRPAMFIQTCMGITAGMIVIAAGIEGTTDTVNTKNIADTEETMTDGD